MRVPISWLHDYVAPDLEVRALAERLAMTGTEVDRVLTHGAAGGLDRFVVGRVLTCVQHPDAERLRLCTLDLGDGEPVEIVCGAPNVAAGQTVAVARPGAVMPDGTKLKRAKLRGVVSNGMILAEDELGIGVDHAGTMVLDDALAPGTPLEGVLPLSTEVLDLEITPNRPDCLGVYGVAREVHAVTGAPLAPPPWLQDPGTADGPPPAGIEVVVEDAELCPRFTGRVFEHVTIAPSPPWLKARLMAAGQRPINNVVDITNYVMLLTGHPLHAFDLDRVAGGMLTVRRARDGERMTTLDGQERVLDAQMGLIADAEGPTSIAGVMGGQRSEVEPDTTRVLMEVATWHGPTINHGANVLGLRSEASARFEKSLPPEGCMEAQIAATQLMLELTGATLVPGTLDEFPGAPGWTAFAPIRLRDARVAGLLGAPVARERSAAILTALGFRVTDADDGLDVAVPHWRRVDVTREADLIEEVARIDGVDRLPATIHENRTGRPGRLTREQRLRRRAEDALAGHGLLEVVGWSFADPGLCDRLLLPAEDPMRRLVVLENPMSEAQSVMRPTIFGSLLDIAAHNAARGTPDIAIFESGNVYRRHRDPAEPLADEHHALGALLSGTARPATWAEPEPPGADAMTAKALVEAVLGALRVDWEAVQAQRPFLHPGRAGEIRCGEEVLGIFGELHPTVAAGWGFEAPVAVLAIDLGKAIAHAPQDELYADLTSFPELRQDLAVIVPDDVPAARVLDVVRGAGAPLIAGAGVFDVYRGEQVGAGRVSLALHLGFRAADRTLTDEDVTPVRDRIVAALREQLGGELRG
ncbi:MAG TPA: phenylalanine--tRNA ligase subunit beta [Solirubrobacteraceae bacterium]